MRLKLTQEVREYVAALSKPRSEETVKQLRIPMHKSLRRASDGFWVDSDSAHISAWMEDAYLQDLGDSRLGENQA